MEHRWNNTGKGKPKYSEENLPYRRFVHHQGFFVLAPYFYFLSSNMQEVCGTRTVIESGPPRESVATNRLNHGTTSFMLPIKVCFLGF